MKIRRRLSEVHAAQARVAAANARLGTSASSVRSWTHVHPLMCVGAAAGAGWLLGRWIKHPWRIPVLVRLVTAQVLPWVSRMVAMMHDEPAS